MIKDKGFDERPWEGTPPLCTEIENLVSPYLPEDKKKDLAAILYGVGVDGLLPGDEIKLKHAITVCEAEDRAWEMIRIKEKFEFIFRMLTNE